METKLSTVDSFLIKQAFESSETDWSHFLFEYASKLTKEQIALCIKSGANINHVGGLYKNNVLLEFLHYSYDIEMIKELINYGADIHHVNGSNQNALFLVLTQNRGFELVKFFLSEGVDPYIMYGERDPVEMTLDWARPNIHSAKSEGYYKKALAVITHAPPKSLERINRYISLVEYYKNEEAVKPIYNTLCIFKENITFAQSLPVAMPAISPTKSIKI